MYSFRGNWHLKGKAICLMTWLSYFSYNSIFHQFARVSISTFHPLMHVTYNVLLYIIFQQNDYLRSCCVLREFNHDCMFIQAATEFNAFVYSLLIYSQQLWQDYINIVYRNKTSYWQDDNTKNISLNKKNSKTLQ